MKGLGFSLCLQAIRDLVFHVCQYGTSLGQSGAGIYMDCWNTEWCDQFPLKWIHFSKHHTGNCVCKSSVKNQE